MKHDRLDESQVRAIEAALSGRLSVTQGPPGTGKTITMVSLLKCLDHPRFAPRDGSTHSQEKNNRTVVMDPSSIAVDTVVSRFIAMNEASRGTIRRLGPKTTVAARPYLEDVVLPELCEVDGV